MGASSTRGNHKPVSLSLRAPTAITCVDICGELAATSAVVRDLGFVIDADLSMAHRLWTHVGVHITI